MSIDDPFDTDQPEQDEAAARARQQREAAASAAKAIREAPLVTIALDTPVDYSGRSFDPEGPEPSPDVTVLDLIIREAARQVIADAESGFGRGYARKSLLDIVTAAVSEQAKARAEAIVEEALSTPFRKTNHMGEPTGPETTLRTMIVDAAHQWLKGSMPDPNNRDAFSGRQHGTIGAPKVVQALTSSALERELSDAVKEATNAARETVKVRASDIVGKAIADGLRFS